MTTAEDRKLSINTDIELSNMASRPVNGGPSGMSASRPNGESLNEATQLQLNGTPTGDDQGYDYTENAPQAVVDAIAIERAREEKEGPPDMMVGSWASWMSHDGESDAM